MADEFTWTDDFKFRESPSAVLTIPSTYPTYFTIQGKNGTIVSICMEDGKVTIADELNVGEAAKTFWEAVSCYYRTAITERNELKAKVERLELLLEGLEAELNDSHLRSHLDGGSDD